MVQLSSAVLDNWRIIGPSPFTLPIYLSKLARAWHLLIDSHMKLKIFGANLRDQSQGQFVVHAADCADCKKLHKLGEHCCVEEHASALSVSRSIWSDMINEGSMTAEDGLQEIHFAPCCKDLA